VIAFLSGDLREFDLDLDWQLVGGFHRQVLQATATIPYGETASYGEVAALAGRPGAARAAGTALSVNPIALIVPCHRIIKADGSTGGYGGGKAGTALKQKLLNLERPCA
jgi:methylated-DNA-[protein]-cysteine S-methyltransferase